MRRVCCFSNDPTLQEIFTPAFAAPFRQEGPLYAFSEKARLEMESDGLTELDAAESILNAVAIYKKVRSGSPRRARAREYLYIIQSTNLTGLAIYTKGKLVKEANQESYYFLVSSKRAL